MKKIWAPRFTMSLSEVGDSKSPVDVPSVFWEGKCTCTSSSWF